LPALPAAAAGLIQPRWHVEIDTSAALAQISCTGVDLEREKIAMRSISVAADPVERNP